ncbi:MAG: 2-keto-4-pentenoate hydratase [Gammaproteobacteria bacterium RIFCSPHIGHO2_12_FULL_63_22]|nr:MAG: 2-keto-4-pentenoate hydratase [Gammaproteobacteria bacterium RIFCSPHIGHO2_12_FULL_63_22]
MDSSQHTSESPGTQAIAAAFVRARLAGTPLDGFPGRIPDDLEAAYACQDAAIALWPDQVVGWKVGYIAPAQRDAGGDPRLVGPIFKHAVWPENPGGILDFPVFVGGFAAVEAEYIFRLGSDVPEGRTEFSADEAIALVASLQVGVETAGSPLATINVLGPRVVVSDFGNNAGLILGPEIPDWTHMPDSQFNCSCSIDGVLVGRGGAGSVPGGLAAALAFAIGRCARRGIRLRAGTLVTTGAATGIHDISVGQVARLDFDGIGSIQCRAVPATASAGQA